MDSKRYFFNDEVRIGLSSLASSFMDKAMNALLGAVLVAFEKEILTTVNGDYLYFFSVLGFFLEYYKAVQSIDSENGTDCDEKKHSLSCFEFLFNAGFVRFLLKKTKEYAENKDEVSSLFPAIYCYKELVCIFLTFTFDLLSMI
jgi:hypothetical protein